MQNRVFELEYFALFRSYGRFFLDRANYFIFTTLPACKTITNAPVENLRHAF